MKGKIKKILDWLTSEFGIFILTLLIIFFTITSISCERYSITIYSITAFIVLLYTYYASITAKANETTAKATEIQLKLLLTPRVNLKIFTNESDQLNTRVRLANFSPYEVHIKLDCKIKIDGKIAKFTDPYCGKEVWRLKANDISEGHFYWLDLLVQNEKIKAEQSKRIKELSNQYDRIKESERLINSFDPRPKLTMDVEYYYHYLEINYIDDLKKKITEKHYDYDFDRRTWIPKLTQPISE